MLDNIVDYNYTDMYGNFMMCECSESPHHPCQLCPTCIDRQETLAVQDTDEERISIQKQYHLNAKNMIDWCKSKNRYPYDTLLEWIPPNKRSYFAYELTLTFPDNISENDVWKDIQVFKHRIKDKIPNFISLEGYLEYTKKGTPHYHFLLKQGRNGRQLQNFGVSKNSPIKSIFPYRFTLTKIKCEDAFKKYIKKDIEKDIKTSILESQIII